MANIKWIDATTLNNSSQKKNYNRQLFSIVAPKYDFITRLMSLNNDQRWKRNLISWIPDGQKNAIILDIASGTGDIPSQIRKTVPQSTIIASDLSMAMFKASTKRNSSWCKVCNDMCHLPIADSTIDIVTGSYALRNAPDLSNCLKEVSRVLKPDGKALFLDFSQSPNPVLRLFHQAALTLWGNFLGTVIHHNPAVYGYIAKSLAVFPDRKELHKLLTQSGLKVMREKCFFYGFIQILEAKKQ
jgi:ubiquinone/menaquinone biosynthesis methyltransferase